MHHDDDEQTGVFDPVGLEEPAPGASGLVIAGRYEIVDRIGEGGMGQVVKARHLRLGKLFAIKLMTAEFIMEPEARAVFVREARLASGLSHPNIVSIVDFGEDDDWGMFIVMELASGELLSDRITRRGPLPVRVVCNVAQQLTEALHHSHLHEIVHGDIKSENVVCADPTPGDKRTWNIKLLDFGMAKIAGAGVDGQRIAGTPAYMAPEQITGGAPQPSVDIYALGVLMYEMLAGSVPFVHDNPQVILRHHLAVDPPPIAERRGESIDDELVAIVARAMAKEPADRFASVSELGQALTGYMQKIGLRRRRFSRRMTTGPGETRDDAAAAAFEALGVAACGLGTDGVIVVANQRMARFLGAGDPFAIEGRSMLETSLGRLHGELRDDLRLVAMDGKVVRRRLMVRDKESRTVTWRLAMTPSTGPGGSCVLVIYPLPDK